MQLKDTWLSAVKAGLICAAILFVMYVAMSLLVDNALYNHDKNPYYPVTDDPGFGWLLVYFGLSFLVILASGPVATWAAGARIRTNKDLLAVPVITCAIGIILSDVAIIAYNAALSTGYLLLYFRDPYTSQATSMIGYCLPLTLVCCLISVALGYATFALKNLGAVSPGK
jgi:hypothetical protein